MKSKVLLFIFWVSTAWAQVNPTPPTIPGNLFNVTNYGAVGNGVATNTTAFQNAFKAAGTAGGGTVEVPAGTYLSGPLVFTNSVNLQLDSGAILRMLPYGSYPGGGSPSPLITASSLHDIEFSGTGAIDGAAENSPWWTNGLSSSARPVLVALSKVNRVLFTNVTIENGPSMHITIKNSSGNINVQGITISALGAPSNTDGIDLLGTNVLVQGCSISTGDDNIALGSTGGTSSGTLITNCSFGTGHGLSIGGNTSGGVSNLTVLNCSFNGTQYGIRLKSDNSSSSGGEGGLTENVFYGNLTMTNITHAAIVIYSYYNEFGTPTTITPAIAAAQPIPDPVPGTTAIWRDVVISNLSASVSPGGIAGIIWGRTELPVTNVLLDRVNITAPATLDVYNAVGFQLANSQITLPAGSNTLTLYNAGVIVTNDSVESDDVSLDGLTSTNSLAIYNAAASASATDLLGADPITVSASTIALAHAFSPPNPTVFDFGLGTNASTISAAGNLTLTGATVNVTNAAGFGAGTYTLFTYTGSLTGTPAMGSAPTNFSYAFDTHTAGQVRLDVTSTGPSLSPVTLTNQLISGQLHLSWPSDHIGWQLEIQTNSPGAGLGNSWSVVSGSGSTNLVILPISPANGSVFLRLAYP